MLTTRVRSMGWRLALAIGVALTTGCSGSGPRSGGGGATVKTEVVNYATSPASVLVVAGVRTSEAPGMVSIAGSGVSPLQPNKRSMIAVNVPQRSAGEFNTRGVVRVRVEGVGASWEQPRVVWYEIVGPMPVVLRVKDGTRPGFLQIEKGPGADLTRVELVPKEWWPQEVITPAPGK